MPLPADSRRIEPFLAPPCTGPYCGTAPTASAVTLHKTCKKTTEGWPKKTCAFVRGLKRGRTNHHVYLNTSGDSRRQERDPPSASVPGPLIHSLTPSLQCVGVSGRRHPSAGELSEQTSSPGRLSDGDGWCCCSWDVSTHLPRHDNNILTRGSCMNSTLVGTREAQIPLLSSFSVRQRCEGW